MIAKVQVILTRDEAHQILLAYVSHTMHIPVDTIRAHQDLVDGGGEGYLLTLSPEARKPRPSLWERFKARLIVKRDNNEMVAV